MKKFLLSILMITIQLSAMSQTSDPSFYELLTASQAQVDALKLSFGNDQLEAWSDYYYWKDYWSKRLSPTGNFKYYRHADSFRNVVLQSRVRSGCEGIWSPLGPIGDPANLGPIGGTVYLGVARIGEIRIDPNNSNYAYAGSPQGGLFYHFYYNGYNAFVFPLPYWIEEKFKNQDYYYR